MGTSSESLPIFGGQRGKHRCYGSQGPCLGHSIDIRYLNYMWYSEKQYLAGKSAKLITEKKNNNDTAMGLSASLGFDRLTL